MFYVYILRSLIHKEQIYVGFTAHLAKRLDAHNSGECDYTKKYKPWEILMYTAFKDSSQALSFEKYLKTSSGKSFALRRFL